MRNDTGFLGFVGLLVFFFLAFSIAVSYKDTVSKRAHEREMTKILTQAGCSK